MRPWPDTREHPAKVLRAGAPAAVGDASERGSECVARPEQHRELLGDDRELGGDPSLPRVGRQGDAVLYE